LNLLFTLFFLADFEFDTQNKYHHINTTFKFAPHTKLHRDL